jgi:hypothetical protein
MSTGFFLSFFLSPDNSLHKTQSRCHRFRALFLHSIITRDKCAVACKTMLELAILSSSDVEGKNSFDYSDIVTSSFHIYNPSVIVFFFSLFLFPCSSLSLTYFTPVGRSTTALLAKRRRWKVYLFSSTRTLCHKKGRNLRI